MKDLALLTDFYQLSMMQGYFFTKPDQTAVFDVFYRKNPPGPSDRSAGLCLHYYLKNCPQHALNFLPEPHKQGCFIVGKATVGSIKYQRPSIFTNADNS